MTYSRIRKVTSRPCSLSPTVQTLLPKSMLHVTVLCVQNAFQSKSFDTHRPHFPAVSICCDAVCRAAEAPCIILSGTFPRPTCSCQWACQQTKEELAYKKEQLVIANIQAHWPLWYTYVLSTSDFSSWRTTRQLCHLNPKSGFIPLPPVWLYFHPEADLGKTNSYI